MKLSQLASTLGWEVVQGDYRDGDIAQAHTSDLLSDVMANAGSDSLLITIQAHKNTVAVATLVGIRGIVLCSSRPVPDDMVEAAASESIGLFRTGETQFAASGRVFPLVASQG